MIDIFQKKILIIADDFAISHGTSTAILELSQKALISGTSVMVTTELYHEYISKLKEKKAKNVEIGLHLDLTFGKARSKSKKHLIVDSKNHFNSSFPKIFFLSFFKKKCLMRFLAREINCQLKTLAKDVGKIDYIDGHQHIHFIPLIFKITQKLAKKYQIKRLRIINENFISSFDPKNPPSPVSIVKFLILKFCYFLNKTKSEIYFYSILYTCKINQKAFDNISRIPHQYIEVMFHPGYSEIDFRNKKNKEFKHLTSNYRNLERKVIENRFRQPKK